MITLLLKLLENLVKLAERRERLNEKEFTRIVEPTLRDTELVYADFLRIFTQLKQRITRTKRSETLIRFLEEERLRLLPVRIRVRALLETDFRSRGEFSKFELGVWGVVCGGISPSVDTHFSPSRRHNPHALLDMVFHLHHRTFEDNKPRFVGYVQHQVEALHYSWHVASVGFAELQLKVANRSLKAKNANPTLRKYEYKRIGD